MKFLFLLSVILVSFTNNAAPIEVDKSEPLRSILKRATCEVVVLKPFTILRGDDFSSSEYFLIGVKTRENSVRKISQGRKILISSMDKNFIIFKDNVIDRACLRKTLEERDIYCEPLLATTISDLEKLSAEAITVTCKDDSPTEI